MPPPRRITILPGYEGSMSLLPEVQTFSTLSLKKINPIGDPPPPEDDGINPNPSPAIPTLDEIPIVEVKDLQWQIYHDTLRASEILREQVKEIKSGKTTDLESLLGDTGINSFGLGSIDHPDQILDNLLRQLEKQLRELDRLVSQVNFKNTPKDPRFKSSTGYHYTLEITPWDYTEIKKRIEPKKSWDDPHGFSYTETTDIISNLKQIFNNINNGCLEKLLSINPEMKDFVNKLKNIWDNKELKFIKGAEEGPKEPIKLDGARVYGLADWENNTIRLDPDYIKKTGDSNMLYNTLIHELSHIALESNNELDIRMLQYGCGYMGGGLGGGFNEFDKTPIDENTLKGIMKNNQFKDGYNQFPCIASQFWVINVCSGEVFSRSEYEDKENVGRPHVHLTLANGGFKDKYVYTDPNGKSHECTANLDCPFSN